MNFYERIPLRWFDSLRRGAATLPRTDLRRKACVAILKAASKGRPISPYLSEIRPPDRLDLSFEPADSMVIDSIYWFGTRGYEGILVDVWAKLCRDARNILEIGGNIGFYTVIGGQASRGDYTVVEPVPRVAEVLRRNLARNNLAIDRVKVIVGAATPDEVARDVQLNIPNEGRQVPVGAHLVAGTEVSNRSTLQSVTVPGFPCAGLAAGRDLIKIDAEGVEAELLTASMPVLAERRPALVIEVLPEAARLARVIAELARAYGYVINVIPAYGSDLIVQVNPDDFTAGTPAKYKSKDVVLATHDL